MIFCTDGIFPEAIGGMQRHSRLLIEALADEGVELVVIHPHDKEIFDHDLISEERIPGIDESGTYLKECKAYSRRTIEVVHRYPDHLIYSQGLSIWADIEDVADRLIINPHGLEPYQALSFKDKLIAVPFKKVFDRLFNQAARVVSLGGSLTNMLRKRIKDHDRIVVLPNAVNLPDDVPIRDEGPLRMLFVGRFASNKGIHILMDSIERVNTTGKEVIFDLAGKGPLFDEYTAKYDISNVNFLGFVSDEDLIGLYRKDHVFVLPTLFEGMPTVVLEAMSNAMPIIVTDVGATAELVDDSNGFLIRKNDVGQLTEAIIKLHDMSSTLRLQLGEASRKKVEEQFTWKQVAKRHIKVFEELKE